MTVLGRTNEAWPDTWLRPIAAGESAQSQALLEAICSNHMPIDISSQPGYWGRAVTAERRWISIGGARALAQTTARQAGEAIEAELFQSVCAAGKPPMDIWFLSVRQHVPTDVLAGVFEAMEMARQDGMIRFLGIFAEGPSDAVRSVWQLNDAFEVLMIGPNHMDLDELVALGRSRRTGIVGFGGPVEFGNAVLLSVRTAEELS